MEDLRTSRASLFYGDHNLQQIRGLMTRGVDPNFKSVGKFTPFQTAVLILEDNIAVVQEIINAGADVNFADNLGYTPLHIAVILGKLRVISTLLKSGANINAKDLLGKTPLHYAVTAYTWGNPLFHKYNVFPNTLIIKKLLGHEDIDYNAVDSNGNTALMLAVKDGQSQSVVTLLHNKADPNIYNELLETALHVAFNERSSLITNELLLHVDCIYSKNKSGHSPINTLIPYLKIGAWSLSIDLLIKVKIIAFKCCASEGLKCKFESLPLLSQFFEKWCEEVDHMRIDYISSNMTIYDFVSNRLTEDRFENFNLQIHKPVVERLTRDIYPEYFYDILKVIPRSSMLAILETFAHSEKIAVIVCLVSDWLPVLDIFRLILAFANVEITESLRNLDVREICAIHNFR